MGEQVVRSRGSAAARPCPTATKRSPSPRRTNKARQSMNRHSRLGPASQRAPQIRQPVRPSVAMGSGQLGTLKGTNRCFRPSGCRQKAFSLQRMDPSPMLRRGLGRGLTDVLNEMLFCKRRFLVDGRSKGTVPFSLRENWDSPSQCEARRWPIADSQGSCPAKGRSGSRPS